MKLVQNTNIRVQGMFFNNCIEKNQNKTHLEEGFCLQSAFHTIQPSYLLAYMQQYNKICNIIFQKWGGGVEGRLDFFQKFIRFGSVTLPIVRIECEEVRYEQRCIIVFSGREILHHHLHHHPLHALTSTQFSFLSFFICNFFFITTSTTIPCKPELARLFDFHFWFPHFTDENSKP